MYIFEKIIKIYILLLIYSKLNEFLTITNINCTFNINIFSDFLIELNLLLNSNIYNYCTVCCFNMNLSCVNNIIVCDNYNCKTQSLHMAIDKIPPFIGVTNYNELIKI